MTGHATRPYLHQISVSHGGVPKWPVPHARVTKSGLEGDRQRSPAIHGGPDRAVCLYSLEAIAALRKEGHTIEPGSAGENFTIAGLDWTRVGPGARFSVGDEVQLEVVSYTTPCKHNTGWFKDRDVSRISQTVHPGWSRVYARVLAEGWVRVGDAVRVEEE